MNSRLIAAVFVAAAALLAVAYAAEFKVDVHVSSTEFGGTKITANRALTVKKMLERALPKINLSSVNTGTKFIYSVNYTDDNKEASTGNTDDEKTYNPAEIKRVFVTTEH